MSSHMSSPPIIIFLDGKMIPYDSRLIESLAPSSLKGEGVFETMLCDNGRIRFLKRHLTRFFYGLKILKLKSPYAARQITEYLYATLRLNKLKNARIRLTVWQEKRRVRISIIALVYAQPSQTKGYRVLFSDIKSSRPG